MESEILPVLNQRMMRIRQGRGSRDEKSMAQLRDRYRQQILDQMISERLLKGEITRKKVTASDAECEAAIQDLININCEYQSWTREEFAQALKDRQGKTIDQFVSTIKANPSLKMKVQMDKLILAEHADQVKVTDEEVKKYYAENEAKKYKKQAQVNASHILVRSADSDSEEKKQEARKKIEQILAEAKKEGADFAALAKKYSDCPSKSKGGNLGFFPRTGKMVEPFAAAAFALKVGEISDIVKTRFGYHIIKVIDKKGEETITLDEVKDQIRSMLKHQKMQPLVKEFIPKLKESAKIVYPKGKELKPAPQLTPRIVPKTRPASAAKPRSNTNRITPKTQPAQ